MFRELWNYIEWGVAHDNFFISMFMITLLFVSMITGVFGMIFLIYLYPPVAFITIVFGVWKTWCLYKEETKDE